MYPKPKKKLKKLTKTAWKKRCDDLLSLKMRTAIPYCQLQGKDKIRCGGYLQAMHIEGRDNYRLRWCTENIIVGCGGHHRYYTSHNFAWIEFVQEWYPEKWKYVKDHINEIAHSIDYEALYKMIQECKLYELS